MAQRLIDADALKESIDEHVYLVHHGFNETEYGCTQYGIHQIIDDAPTVDAVPSETLYDFIKELGSITYGKERFFHEEIGLHCGLWYDRKTGEWITTQTAIEECLKSVRELDDGDIDADPVRHGKWVFNPSDAFEAMFAKPKCSECGFESADGLNYCPNCGCRMDKDGR